MEGQPSEQFRLAAYFQPEVVRLAGIQNLFDDFAQLVDLDGEHPAIAALVAKFGDGISERHVDRFHSMTKDVLKANQHRELQAARLGFLDHIREVHRGACLLQWLGDNAPRFINVEVLGAPTLNAVQIARLLDIPGLGGVAA